MRMTEVKNYDLCGIYQLIDIYTDGVYFVVFLNDISNQYADGIVYFTSIESARNYIDNHIKN